MQASVRQPGYRALGYLLTAAIELNTSNDEFASFVQLLAGVSILLIVKKYYLMLEFDLNYIIICLVAYLFVVFQNLLVFKMLWAMLVS